MFLSRLLAPLRRRPAGAGRNPPEAPTRSESLQDKLARWRRQADEYERLGCRELARELRESIRTHERALAAKAWRTAA